MHLYKTHFHQNPNVGLCSYANDRFCLLPLSVPQQQRDAIAETLKVPVHQTNICGTSLLGAFIAGNNTRILVPGICFDAELAMLEQRGIPHTVLETDYTALGNLIAANEQACLIAPELEPVKADIKKALKVSRISVFELPEVHVTGSLIALNGRGVLLSAFASKDDEERLGKFFGVKATRGTVNLGSPFVRSGITANTHGFLLGSRTGGPEAIHIDQALGFLD